MMEITLRKAQLTDVEAIRQLFFETITEVNSRDYSPDQISIWSASAGHSLKWMERVIKHYFIVAVAQKKIVGFAALTGSGDFDCLYVHKDFQRNGVGQLLLNHIEQEATKRALSLITSDVSITAKPFFQRNGYEQVKINRKKRNGMVFITYAMEKKNG
jgi:N-acetylglutamate synthase-like GNAT family acetyltransferase